MNPTRNHLRAACRSLGRRQRQRGASLLFSLIALVGLSLAGMAMLRTADTSTMVAGNIGFHGAAVQATDLAQEAALATIISMASANTLGSNNTGLGYYASLDSSAPDPMLPPSSRLSDANGVSMTDSGTGNALRYTIERMCNATGAPTTTGCVLDGATPLHRVTTLVRGPRNTSETVQSLLMVSVFSPTCAIMTRTTMQLPGTTNLGGSGNCVFSNGNVSVGGMLNNTGGYAAAVGSVGDSAKITGAKNPNQLPMIFPTFNTNDYRPYADYIFRSNGQIWQRSTNSVLGTYTGGSKWYGWYRESTSPVRWRLGDSKTGANKSPAGLYYFEGNVGISGSVGGSSDLWNVSFIAEGSIQVSGECYFSNYAGNGSAPQAVNNLFMMARGDIEMNGNSSSTPVSGLIITNEELKFNGNNTINGNLISLNANNSDPSSLDNLISLNEFSGTTNINYDPDAANNLWQPVVKRVQWRTVPM